MSDFCVIGSGPSAVSAAMALTRRNLRVTMLDAGLSLESPRMEVVRRMSRSRPTEWRAEDLRSIREGIEVTGGIPLRRAYGSGFAFDTTGAASVLSRRNAGIQPSFALGGLSNVWGAGMLPFHRDDLEDWPREASDLDPHYKSVLSFMPLAGERDALESLFPLFADAPGRFPPTQQGRGFPGSRTSR